MTFSYEHTELAKIMDVLFYKIALNKILVLKPTRKFEVTMQKIFRAVAYSFIITKLYTVSSLLKFWYQTEKKLVSINILTWSFL